MDVNLKQAYNEYLRNHRFKQNRGANGRNDTEKSKTYQAEFAFQRRYKVRKFATIEEAHKRAKQIYKTKKWQKVWKLESRTDRDLMKQPAVVLKERNTGRGFAGWSDGWSVVLDSNAGLDEYTLLHELTHCLGHMHHGRSFRRALLELVGAFIGSDAKKILKEEFAKRKLKCGKARQPLTYAQWNAARKKMEKIRNV